MHDDSAGLSWEQQYREYCTVTQLPDRHEAKRRRTIVVRRTRALLARGHRQQDAWVHAALLDQERKWFVAKVLAANVPHRFFDAMIHAAVYEINPSMNRRFVEPCIRSQGHRRVNEALLEYLEHGNNFEIAGAVNALYWAQASVQYTTGRIIDERTHKPTAEAQATYEAWADLHLRKRRAYLRIFVTNEDTEVRQSLIGRFSLNLDTYPVEMQHLVPEAIAIASQHPDPYIRHRIALQLGATHLIPSLPHRQPPAAIDPAPGTDV